jgi:hypothetical protein
MIPVLMTSGHGGKENSRVTVFGLTVTVCNSCSLGRFDYDLFYGSLYDDFVIIRYRMSNGMMIDDQSALVCVL